MKRLRVLYALLHLSAFPALAEGWSVAIEQTPMTTACGGVTNIPVAPATSCSTAISAAQALLATLTSTPGCLSYGCKPGETPRFSPACTQETFTRPNGDPAKRWQVGMTWTCAAARYDINARLRRFRTLAGNEGYEVKVRNNGPAVPGPYRATFRFSLPNAAKVKAWNLNGWTCAPGPVVSGPVDIDCTVTTTTAHPWPNATVLSNQGFWTDGSAMPGACVQASLWLPDAANTFVLVNETNSNNNMTCVTP